MTYAGHCHCGAIRFQLTSEPITTGIRCNCSICIRRGVTWSTSYYAPDAFELVSGRDSVSGYMFGDRCMKHSFCATCGISPFTMVADVPPDYTGPARPGYVRVNLGCIDELDHAALEVALIDGRSF